MKYFLIALCCCFVISACDNNDNDVSTDDNFFQKDFVDYSPVSFFSFIEGDTNLTAIYGAPFTFLATNKTYKDSAVAQENEFKVMYNNSELLRQQAGYFLEYCYGDASDNIVSQLIVNCGSEPTIIQGVKDDKSALETIRDCKEKVCSLTSSNKPKSISYVTETGEVFEESNLSYKVDGNQRSVYSANNVLLFQEAVKEIDKSGALLIDTNIFTAKTSGEDIDKLKVYQSSKSLQQKLPNEATCYQISTQYKQKHFSYETDKLFVYQTQEEAEKAFQSKINDINTSSGYKNQKLENWGDIPVFTYQSSEEELTRVIALVDKSVVEAVNLKDVNATSQDNENNCLLFDVSTSKEIDAMIKIAMEAAYPNWGNSNEK